LRPISTTNNRTIFHQLDVSETGANNIDVSFKLKTPTSTSYGRHRHDDRRARQPAEHSQRQRGQLRAASSMLPAGVGSCNDLVAEQSDQLLRRAADCGKCSTAPTPTWMAPDNNLRTEGVVGAIRCLVGRRGSAPASSRAPHPQDPESYLALEGDRYGDRDEQVYRHLIDMTPDYARVRSALGAIDNYNRRPGGGFVAVLRGRRKGSLLRHQPRGRSEAHVAEGCVARICSVTRASAVTRCPWSSC
jgi:hypothetical protein